MIKGEEENMSSKIFFEKPELRTEKEKLEVLNKDINTLVKESYPYHEHQHPIFKKFGFFLERWFFNKGWETSTTETEKWKYVALCSLYWLMCYQDWYEEEQYRSFVRDLEDMPNGEGDEWLKKLGEFDNDKKYQKTECLRYTKDKGYELIIK